MDTPPSGTTTQPSDTTPEPQFPRPAAEAGALRARILDLLGPSPQAEDQLIRDLGTAAAVAVPELVALELEGAVRRHPGGMISRA